MVRQKLSISRHQMAKLAVASYLNGGTDQQLLALFSGHTRGIMDRSAMITYLAHQHSVRQRVLKHLILTGDSADQATRTKIVRLRKMINALERQRARPSSTCWLSSTRSPP